MDQLIGRSGEIEALRAALARALDGHGQAALIEGESGIGKSRLIEEAVASLRRADAVLLHGIAAEYAATRPFGALARPVGDATAISPDVRDLLVAAASGRDPQVATAQYHVIDSLLDHLEELAASTAIAVVVDDAQWADPSTLLTLHGLLQRLPDLPMLLLVALRPLPRPPALDRLVEAMLAAPGPHLPLEPLAPDDIEALLTASVEAPPGDSLRRQVRRAGGNPFYLHELLRTLADEHAIEVRQGHAEVDDDTFPATLGSTILRHLRYLPEAATGLLELAAVLGSTFTTADLAAVSRRPVEELLGPLRQAIEADVLRDRDDGLAFRHDLVREALYRRLPRAARGELHLAVGRALASIDAPAPRVATHLAIGAAPGDAEAVSWLRRAAVATTMSSPAVAEDLMRRALDLTLPGDTAHDEVRADLATLLVACGQAEAAHALAHEVLEGPHPPELDGRLRFALGQAAFMVGRYPEAIEQMELAARHPSLSSGEQALALAEVGMARLLGAADLAGAERDAEEAVAAARAASDRFAEAMGRCVLAGVAQFRGGIGAAIDAVDAATALAVGPLDLAPGELNSALRDPEMFRGMALLDVDRPDEAEAAFRAGSRLSATRGVAGRGHFYHFWLGLRHHQVGAWDDALAELQTGLDFAEEVDTRRGAIAAHALVATIALHRDDLEVAAAHLAAAETLFEQTGPDFGVEWMLLARASIAEAGGDAATAHATLTQAWDLLSAVGSRFHYRTLGPDLVRLALAEGDADRAARVTGALEDLAGQEAVPSLSGVAAYARGLVAAEPDQLTQAADHLRAARRPLATARALEDAAVLLARRDGGTDREAARRRFAEADGIYRELGADRAVARLAAAARHLGVPAGVRGPRRRPDTGWESLTPTEQRVVRLVADGLSNPQVGERLFISRRTVQTHLSNVFRKLGIASRVELAAEVARRESAPLP